jgi:hypothetical protein
MVSRLNENDGFCSYGCDRKFRVCWYSVRNAEDAGRYVPPGAEQTDRHLRQQRRTQRAIAKGPRNDGPDSAELIKRHRDSLKRRSARSIAVKLMRPPRCEIRYSTLAKSGQRTPH